MSLASYVISKGPKGPGRRLKFTAVLQGPFRIFRIRTGKYREARMPLGESRIDATLSCLKIVTQFDPSLATSIRTQKTCSNHGSNSAHSPMHPNPDQKRRLHWQTLAFTRQSADDNKSLCSLLWSSILCFVFAGLVIWWILNSIPSLSVSFHHLFIFLQQYVLIWFNLFSYHDVFSYNHNV